MAALDPAEAVASSILALQGAHAVLTAGVLWVFERRFRNPALGYWRAGWLALAVQVAGLATLRALDGHVAPTAVRVALLVALTLAAGYAKVVWLVLGAFAVAMGRALSRSLLRTALVVGVAVAVVSAVPFAGDPDPLPRFLARHGTMAVLTGIGQLAAGLALWLRTTHVRALRALRGTIPPGWPALGQRLVAVAFVALGGLAFVSLVGALAEPPAGEVLPSMPAMNESQLLLNFTLGLGLVIWLLEGEQRRTLDAAQRAEHMAYHDPLTGLPNRLLLVDRLRQLVAQARRTQQPFAVFFLDVDHFKAINDTYGHAAGDRILQQLAARLTAQLREVDTVARLGGDEFIVLTPDVRAAADLAAIGDKLRDAARAPITFDDREVCVTVSVGVSLYPDDGDDADALLRRSDGALYEAKASGRDAVRLA